MEQQEGGKEAAISLMQMTNPAIIPRNHQVESMIESAVVDKDFQPFYQLLKVVAKPFDTSLDNGPYSQPPAQDEVVTQTFCGT